VLMMSYLEGECTVNWRATSHGNRLHANSDYRLTVVDSGKNNKQFYPGKTIT
jgi:hypothetical protein